MKPYLGPFTLLFCVCVCVVAKSQTIDGYVPCQTGIQIYTVVILYFTLPAAEKILLFLRAIHCFWLSQQFSHHPMEQPLLFCTYHTMEQTPDIVENLWIQLVSVSSKL